MAKLPKDTLYHYESKDGISITVTMTEVVNCRECKFNYGVANNCEFNPHDIVCTYFETDGMDAKDFCSYGARKDDPETHTINAGEV